MPSVAAARIVIILDHAKKHKGAGVCGDALMFT